MISCTLVKHDSRSRSSITSILRVTLLTKHLGDEKLLFTVHYFVWKIYGNGEMPSILRSGFFYRTCKTIYYLHNIYYLIRAKTLK